MHCSNCGAELRDGAKFCMFCGAEIKTVAVADNETTNNDNVETETFDNQENVIDTDAVSLHDDFQQNVLKNSDQGIQIIKYSDSEKIKIIEDFNSKYKTEIIFDRRSSKEKLKRNNTLKNVVTVFAFLLIIGISVLAFYSYKNSVSYVGLKTLKDGKVVFSKGHNEYATNERVKDDLTGKYYYFDENSEMVKSQWIEIEGDWYYFGDEGVMAKSEWVKDGGFDYYVDSYGKMMKNTTTPDGYFVGPDGKYIDLSILETTTQANNGSGWGAGSYNPNPVSPVGTVAQTQVQTTKDPNVIRNIGVGGEVESPGRDFYVSGYQSHTTYTESDDETNPCDITINYPIMQGTDAGEVASINSAIANSVHDMVVKAEGQIFSQSSFPKTYKITTAKTGVITDYEVRINLIGEMQRTNASKLAVRMTFIYNRDSRDGYIQ